MKLTDLQGTYVSVRPVGASRDLLVALMEKLDVPNPVPAHKLHVTLLYSRRALRTIIDPNVEYRATPTVLHLFDEPNGRQALVLKLGGDELHARHQFYRSQGGTHDFADYTPHVTLSYDAAGFNVNQPTIEHDLVFGLEEAEELIL